MPLEESNHWVEQVGEQDGEAKDDDDGASHVRDANYDCEEKRSQQASVVRRSGNDMIFPPEKPNIDGQPVLLSNLCLIEARAFSSEERVLSTATLRTIPPFSPVSPACCEHLIVIR